MAGFPRKDKFSATTWNVIAEVSTPGKNHKPPPAKLFLKGMSLQI